MKTYIGKPCRDGHVERRISNNNCIECSKRLASEYYAKHKDRCLLRILARQKAKRDQINEYHKAYRAKNPDKVKLWTLTSKQRETSEDKQRRRDRNRGYYAQDTLRYLSYNNTYRARKMSAGGFHTDADLHDMYIRQNGRCIYCCVTLQGTPSIDHIVPLSRGGSNWPSNLCLTCVTCNKRKNARPAIELCAELLSGF